MTAADQRLPVFAAVLRVARRVGFAAARARVGFRVRVALRLPILPFIRNGKQQYSCHAAA